MTTLLLCLDCETSGLDPAVDIALEVGWILISPDLATVYDQDTHLLAPPTGVDCAKVEQLMIQVVRDMHNQSGLWAEWCAACSSKTMLTPGLVAREIVERIDQVDRDATVHLAGSGVERFDRGFIDRHLPALGARLHYAAVDISSVRRFAQIVCGVDLEAPGDKPHRGLADAEHALTTMRTARDWMTEVPVP